MSVPGAVMAAVGLLPGNFPDPAHAACRARSGGSSASQTRRSEWAGRGSRGLGSTGRLARDAGRRSDPLQSRVRIACG